MKVGEIYEKINIFTAINGREPERIYMGLNVEAQIKHDWDFHCYAELNEYGKIKTLLGYPVFFTHDDDHFNVTL